MLECFSLGNEWSIIVERSAESKSINELWTKINVLNAEEQLLVINATSAGPSLALTMLITPVGPTTVCPNARAAARRK